MRIISGQFSSRQLKGTPPAGLRPPATSFAKPSSIFLGQPSTVRIFLDACAGMGGVGIEAISRGAQSVYFVDPSRKATAIIRENLATLRIDSGFRILEMELHKASRSSNAKARHSILRFWILRMIAKTCTLWPWNPLAAGHC